MIDNGSRLPSWLFWRDLSTWAFLFKQLDYTFPENDWKTPCPICGGAAIVQYEGDKWFCLCDVLRWQSEFISDRRELNTVLPYKPFDKIESPVGDRMVVQTFWNAVEGTKDFIKKPDNWLVFQGDNGCGKSMLLAAIQQAYAPICIYITGGSIERKLFQSRGNGGPDAMILSLSTIPILLIDDWGMEYGGDWVNATIAQVVNQRYINASSFPTVMATNMGRDDLLSSKHRRAASRFIDTQISKVFEIKTGDYRRRKPR